MYMQCILDGAAHGVCLVCLTYATCLMFGRRRIFPSDVYMLLLAVMLLAIAYCVMEGREYALGQGTGGWADQCRQAWELMVFGTLTVTLGKLHRIYYRRPGRAEQSNIGAPHA